MIDGLLLEIVVCPSCLGKLEYREEVPGLVCTGERLMFPIRDGIPVLILEEARPLDPG